ncbi:uncharacterized protein BKCO1_2800034 [Diplodia corticola]|uniref:Uncharacterized protein n=1 Tax=Diplodia corticola TaxID=236234 RepID=A0A1J9RM71_9PEZI|nr:uncharacterized protein BKCO1_2800034 [Diplodia corticola]OJD33675.1 hypothetical protein BKCO1_2800034 [Diplodia corticola]
MFGLAMVSKLAADIPCQQPAPSVSAPSRPDERFIAMDSEGRSSSSADTDRETLLRGNGFPDYTAADGNRHKHRCHHPPKLPRKPISTKDWPPKQRKLWPMSGYKHGTESIEALEHSMVLQQHLHRLQEQFNEEKEEVRRLADENDRIKRAADKLQISMNKKDVIFADQPPDDYILGRVFGLLGQIKGWSTHFLRAGSVGPAALKEADLEHYRAVFPGARNLDALQQQFQDKKRRRLFVRGWTAYAMCDAVFSTPRDDRLNDDSAVERMFALESMMRSMDVPPGKVNDWRALSFQLLPEPECGSETGRSAPQWLQEECKRVFSVIAPWVKSGKALPEVEDQLLCIFQQALSISALLRRQRACWTLGFPGIQQARTADLLLFDSAYMKVEDREASKTLETVEVVVTPAVYKQGNAEGEFFNVITCLDKAAVVLSPTPISQI